MKKVTYGFAAAALSTTCAHAAVVNIDIGRVGNSTSVIDGGLETFNNITDSTAPTALGGVATGASPIALVDSTGAASGFSLGVELVNIPNDEIAEAGSGGDATDLSAASSFIGTIPDTALQDGLFMRDETANGPTEFYDFVFSGLDASGAELYSFTIYSGRTTNGLPTNFIVTSGSGVDTDGFANVAGNTDVITFANLLADSNGEIEVRVTAPGNTGSGTINFIQLESDVPEPGSLALLGLGGLMIARRRRK